MLYFNANAGDFLNIVEHPLPPAGMRSHLPPQPHTSPQMLSYPEDEDTFTSTSPQQDSETPGAASSPEDEPLCTDLLTGLPF